MITSSWLYELLLLLHSLSLVGYIVYFISSNWIFKQVSYWLFVTVWTMQTISILYEFFITKTFPFMSLNEGVYFYAWILLTFTFMLNRFLQVHFIVLLANVFAYFMMTLSVLLNAGQQSIGRSSELMHEILIAHITFSILSYGFFTLSFLLATMYLIQYYLLKKKKGLHTMWRFSNLDRLDFLSYIAVVAGVPLLLIGLILGIAWAYVSGDTFYWYDLKTIGSIVLLVIYSFYLLLRQDRKFTNKSKSIYSSATFLVLLVNFFLFSVLSDFHFL